MSRFEDEVGFETVEEYEEYENDLEEEELENLEEDEYEYHKDLCQMKETLYEYCRELGLPICEHLTAEDLGKFIEKTLQ